MSDKWRDYYTEEQLTKLHSIELDILSVFIDVCKRLEIEFFLYGGTLLGQVKYNGFIPWDDDIDLAMPRPSYEKFVGEASLFLPEGYYLQSPYNCPKSPYPYTKLRKCNTKFVEYSNRNLDIENGIYIDIYPVDRIPDDENKRFKQFKKVRKWIFIFVCRQSRLYDKKEDCLKGYIKNIIRFFACKILKIFPQQYCMKKIDEYMKKYNNTNNTRFAAMNSPNYNNIYDTIYPLMEAKFHDLDIYLPADYENHLYRRYGNYTKLPPENERFGHIPYIIEM